MGPLTGWVVMLGVIGSVLVKASRDVEGLRWLEPLAPVKGRWLVLLILFLALIFFGGLTLPLALYDRR